MLELAFNARRGSFHLDFECRFTSEWTVIFGPSGAGKTTLLLPLARRSLIAAAVLSFLHTMGEFGVVLMLGGDIPGATRTLSIVLYNQVENFDYAAANRTAAILLGLSAIALAAIYLGRSSRGGRRA